MKYLTKKLYYFTNKVFAVRSDLLGIFAIALLVILLIDLVKSTYFQTSFIVRMVDFIYKLCLAYITGFIFYFINVHLQLEKNKLKTFRYINNKFANINFITNCLIASLRIANGQAPYSQNQISEEDLLSLCKGINPSKPFQLYIPYNRTFNHWTECVSFLSMEYKVVIQELLFVKDVLDSELIVVITDIDEYLDNLNRLKGTMLGNQDISNDATDIYGLYSSNRKLYKVLRTKYKHHEVEYHHNYRRNNSKQK